ncbi:hypothetical protein F4779DRAFT_622433 [Xylariaceae sp. FL0662B]|nr:hypothetical protein F4779DRAFT_622433 [Xylariaceae sp. FL0662B]
MSFDTSGVSKPETPDFVLEHASFQVYMPWYHMRRDQERFSNGIQFASFKDFYRSMTYSIAVTLLKSPVLRYRYTNSFHWYPCVEQVLNRSTLVQLVKLDQPTIDQLVGVKNPQDLVPRIWEFDKPASWVYLDHLIPELNRRIDEERRRE